MPTLTDGAYCEQRQYETVMIRVGEKMICSSRPMMQKQGRPSVIRKILVANGVTIRR